MRCLAGCMQPASTAVHPGAQSLHTWLQVDASMSGKATGSDHLLSHVPQAACVLLLAVQLHKAPAGARARRRCSTVMVKMAWERLEWRFMPVAPVARRSAPCSSKAAISAFDSTCSSEVCVTPAPPASDARLAAVHEARGVIMNCNGTLANKAGLVVLRKLS